jgi:hypothetical protein
VVARSGADEAPLVGTANEAKPGPTLAGAGRSLQWPAIRTVPVSVVAVQFTVKFSVTAAQLKP